MTSRLPKRSQPKANFASNSGNFGDQDKAREIRELRKSGRLEEARKMAVDFLDDNPDDPSVKSEYAWTLYNQVKDFRAKGDNKKADDALDKLKNVGIEGNNVLDDCIARIDVDSERNCLLRELRTFDQNSLKNEPGITKAINAAKSFFDIKQERAHAIDVNILNWVNSNLSNVAGFDYVDFVQKWGIEHFTKEDEEGYTSQSGNYVDSIILRVAKRLGRRANEFELDENQNEFVRSFIDKYILTFDDADLYRYKAGLTEDRNEAIKLYKKAVAKADKDDQKSQILFDFAYQFVGYDDEIAWALMAESLGLNSSINENRRRRAFAEASIKLGKYAEAKYEIEKLKDRAVKNGYSLKRDAEGTWIQEEWYSTTTPAKNDRKYRDWGEGAESILTSAPKEETPTVKGTKDTAEGSASANKNSNKNEESVSEYEIGDDTIPF